MTARSPEAIASEGGVFSGCEPTGRPMGMRKAFSLTAPGKTKKKIDWVRLVFFGMRVQGMYIVFTYQETR